MSFDDNEDWRYRQGFEAGSQAERKKIVEARKALEGLRLAHHKARYEGDGDPGCYNNCGACALAEALEALR